jgi:arginine N-succinyltransferase
LFVRMHRAVFRDRVLSELLPPLEPDGTSKLWESVGRHFTGLTYQEADRLSKDNKEFIHALFPDEPIHTELLPEDVREIIGKVGPETEAVERMLRRVGFDYAGQIDPFDGGPHFVAATDQITIVRDAREVPVRVVDAPGPVWCVIGIERAGERPGFRAIGARVVPPAADSPTLGITDEARRRLAIAEGDAVWMARG